MNEFDRYTDDVWDRFFDFVSEPVSELSQEEVREELTRYGLDITSAVSRVQRALATAKAKNELAAAREKRTRIVEKLTSVVAPKIEGLRERLDEIIAGKLKGSVQAAYFRKLEKASDEDDLRRLMDDIERLDALADIDETETET
ncbi:hypothetical protein RBSH_04447 [Rhodopirellula baltica SH28]|uniref:Uncharacterized protein n=1 Tax=Rhodopirellula baltica SH28 TaxID=993517 RepID=K5E2U7_RHOBT|nr:hypothetical protein [Rhodopirellula baltica]EKK00111.1 hypothetical protein RBSH_04447 [Rhodopirellula baltica SH28]